MANDSEELNANHRQILEGLLNLPENMECADCKSKRPNWASVNLGVFICMQCSEHHRSLGVHLSKIRSTTLDIWLPGQVAFIQSMGNAKANSYWEAQLPSNYDRVGGIENFIFAKYEDKRWVSKDGIQKLPSSEPEENLNPHQHRPAVKNGHVTSSPDVIKKVVGIESFIVAKYEDKRHVSKDGIQKLPSSKSEENLKSHHHISDVINEHGHVTMSTHLSEERTDVLRSHTKENISVSRINPPASPKESEPVVPDSRHQPQLMKLEATPPPAEAAKVKLDLCDMLPLNDGSAHYSFKSPQSADTKRYTSYQDHMTVSLKANRAESLESLSTSPASKKHKSTLIEAMSHIKKLVGAGLLLNGSRLWCFSVSLLSNEEKRALLLLIDEDQAKRDWLKWEFMLSGHTDPDCKVG